MGKEEQKLSQPSVEAQRLYMSLVNDDAEEVVIPRTNKKYKIHWLKNGQLEKLTRLLLHKKSVDEDITTGSEVMDAILEDAKLACKASAIIILNGYWKLKFRYWFLWRWFYYVRQYENMQLAPLLEVGKKKVPLLQFYHTTTLLTGVQDSLMRMRAKEVEATLREHPTAVPSQTENSDNG